MNKMLSALALLLASVLAVHGSLPEEELTVPELIRYWGYPVESHQVLTKDGYYLTLHRIPHGKQHNTVNSEAFTKPTKPVMFLQHGLLCSSSNWVVNLPKQSLGFMAAEAGFDVWMGNVRGNTYSRKHKTLDSDSKKFWDFTFDEMARYDLPAMVDYALEHSGEEQLYYVGHSQGTMIGFAGFGENEQLAKKIKVFFALAPVSRLANIYSPIKYLSDFIGVIKPLFSILQVHEFLPSTEVVKEIAEKVCPIDEKICDKILFLISGYDKSNLNKTRTPVYLTHTPAGTSTKNLYHFSQLVQSGEFRKYDYGYVRNLVKYHSLRPASYDLSKVNTRVMLISGSEDWLAEVGDVVWLRKQLPKVIAHNQIKGYNHLDFIWGMNARSLVYKPIINMAMKFERKTGN